MEWNIAWDIIKTLKDWWEKKPKPPTPIIKTSPEAVAQRFISMFEHHDVQRSQIPAFFGHDLKLKDFKTIDTLIDVLNDDILKAAAELFAVRRE